MRKIRRIIPILLVIVLLLTSVPTDILAKTNDSNQGKSQQGESGVNSGDISDGISTGLGYKTEFQITSQWPGSFNSEIILRNTSTETIENWALKFEFVHQISNIWNADITYHTDNTYIVKNKQWNADIAPGEEVRVGITAAWSDVITNPSNIVLCSKRQDVAPGLFVADFRVTNDWKSGFNGNITIINNSDQAIEHWTLEFDFDHDIINFWDAEIISNTNNHFKIKHRNYNAIIQPGQTITLGFDGNPGNVVTKPTNYSLTSVNRVSDSQEVPCPIVEIYASPDTITKGESTILTWNAANADKVTIEQKAVATATGSSIIAISAVTGSSITVTPMETTIYTITASVEGSSQTAIASVTVNVLEVAAPNVQLYASSLTIRQGESTTLTWTSQGGEKAYINHGIGIVSPNGSCVVSPDNTTTYNLTVTGEHGSTDVSIIITILGNTQQQKEGSFGYTYNSMIPCDATLESYDEERFSLVTGTVYNMNNEILPGVRISIENHPEYGMVSTDSQGLYSIPVEGGDNVTVIYTKDGYLSCMRKIYAPWNEIAVADKVQMTTVDTVDTSVIFDGNPATVTTHHSSNVTDEFGTRDVTMVFQGDNQAWAVDEYGNDIYQLDTITVRATEFTTPESMPAVLPPTSAFTYCTELQVDGVDRVRFEKPVSTWVDNFLDFPVGESVPVGYFDRDKNVWVPSADGIVVMLLDTNADGFVDALDTDGDNLADITDPEQLLGLEDTSEFKPGNTYWKVEVSHFTPWDYNWPIGLPEGAIAPNSEGVAQNQNDLVFYEDIAIPGTDESLYYASDRTAGYRNVITVPVSGDSVPACLSSIVVQLDVAGQTLEKTISPLPNQIVEFEWNGLDFLGNPVNRAITAKVSIGFVYQGIYYSTAGAWEKSFAMAGDAPLTRGTRDQIIVWDYSTLKVNTNLRRDSFGEGWTITSHNQLILGQDKTLLMGNGTTQEYTDIRINETVTYFDEVQSYPFVSGFSATADDSVDVYGYYPQGIAMDAAGNIYTTTNNHIVKVDHDGNKTVIAGNGSYGFSGDGGPATVATLNYPTGIDVDRNGTIYFADTYNNCIRKIDTNGIITTVAGVPESGGVAGLQSLAITEDNTVGDNGLAVYANLSYPRDVKVDVYGYLYVADSGNNRIRKIDPNGIITTVAGNGDYDYSGDNGMAIQATLNYPSGIALDIDGNLYIADSDNLRIRKVDVSGIITTIAGNGSYRSIDGVQAIESGMERPVAVALDSNGSLYIADCYNNTIRKVYSDGVIDTIAGASNDTIQSMGKLIQMSVGDEVQRNEAGELENGAALSVPLNYPSGLVIDSIGNVYIADSYENRICKITTPPAYIAAAMEDAAYVFIDGDVYYTFGTTGLQLKTVDLATGVVLQRLTYNANKLLVSIEDQFGNRITIERDVAGTPTAILSPDGIRTSLTIAGGKLTNVTYPSGADYEYKYSQDGLLTEIRDFNDNLYKASYDLIGRLSSVEDSERGLWKYNKTVLPTGDVVTTITSAEGRVTTCIESYYADGSGKITVKDPNGDETVQTTTGGNTNIYKSMPDGSTFTCDYNLDPQYYTEYMKTVSEKNQLYSGLTTESGVTYEDTNDDGISDIITTTVTDNKGTITTIHNILDSSITTTSRDNRTMRVYYNPNTLLIERKEVPGILSTYYEYDERGHLILTKIGERRTEFQYNQNGLLAKVIGADHKETAYEYNEVGQVTAIHRPDGSTIYQEYDNNGNLEVLTIPGDTEHTYDYNSVDSAVKYTTPISGEYNYSYNRDRQLTSNITPDEKETYYIYNDIGQLIQIDTPDGDTISMEYLDDNMLKKISKNKESITYDYIGSLVTSTSISGTLDSMLEYTYNKDQSINSITYAGRTKTFLYDDDGLLIEAGNFIITRNPDNGLAKSISDGNINISREYNGYEEINANTYSISDRTPLVCSLDYDDNGNITKKVEILDGVTSTYIYTYDDLGRLLTVTKDGSLTEQYKYDAIGRRIAALNKQTDIAERRYIYSEEDQLLSSGNILYEYDLDGYLTKKTDGTELTLYQYSSEGELLKVTLPNGTEIEYIYDALGRRVAKVFDGIISEKYLWEGSTNLVAVYDGDNNLKMRFEYAEDLRPISMIKDGVTYYLAYDQVGSLRLVTDATGNIIKRIDYDSFGNIIKDTNDKFSIPFGFSGGLNDSTTGLVYFGARDYDPETGRWIAKDPISFNGGDIDLYAYCSNNPIKYTDATGLYTFEEGNAAHRTLQSYFMIYYSGNSKFRPRIEYRVPVLSNKSGYGRADMVLISTESIEVYEIKSYTQRVVGRAQLNRYIIGIKATTGRDVVAGTTFKTYGIVLADPTNPNRFFLYRSYTSDPGMIYYDIKHKRFQNPATVAVPDNGIVKKLAKAGTAVVVGYVIYRVIRFIPSLFPGMEWSIPYNLAFE